MGRDANVRLARFTREDRAYGASHLPKTSENDCFAVYITCYPNRSVQNVNGYKMQTADWVKNTDRD